MKLKRWIKRMSLPAKWQGPAIGVVLGVPIGMAVMSVGAANGQSAAAFFSGGAALFIALWGQSVREKEAMRRGVLAAARMQPRLVRLRVQLQDIRKNLNSQWADIDPTTMFHLRRNVSEVQPQYDLQDLDPLIPLNGDPALAALRALRSIESLKFNLARGGSPDDLPDTQQDRRRGIQEWILIVDDAIAALESAELACKEALPAELGARVFY